MTCHRDGARHCSCTPEAVESASPEHGSRLLLDSFDPRAHAALRLLAAPLAAEVVTTGPGTSSLSGDVAALLLAAAGSIVVGGPGPGGAAAGALPVGGAPAGGALDAGRREPASALPHRAELLASLDRAMTRRRPGTTTGLLFCAVGDSAPGGAVLGAVAARIRSHLRRSDVLAHLGEGRFVALLSDLPLTTGEGSASRVVAAVRDAMVEPVATGAGLFPLRALVGVLVHPSDPEEAAREEAARDEPQAVAPPTAELVLTVVERAMERGSLPTG